MSIDSLADSWPGRRAERTIWQLGVADCALVVGAASREHESLVRRRLA